MQAQYDNQLFTSFMLYLDHEILRRGQAYQNMSSLFYPVDCPIQGLYAYAAPYKPFVNDISITGAQVMSGINLNGNFVKVGQSGLYAINHYQGAVYFTSPLPDGTVISGDFALKDTDIRISDQPEYKLLFETEYYPQNNYNQTPSGIPLDAVTTPIIYLRSKTQENKPFAFAGLDNNTMVVRGVSIMDTAFQKVAVNTILKNLNLHQLPIIQSTPFWGEGYMTGVNYDYTALPQDQSYVPWILSVRVIDVPQAGEFRHIIRNMSMVDFELSTIRANR